MTLIQGLNEDTGATQDILITGGGAVLVEEQAPAYLQGDVCQFSATWQEITKNTSAVLSTNLIADAIERFSPVLAVKSKTNGSQVTIEVTFQHSLDDGVIWNSCVDSSGNEIKYTLTCSSSTVPTAISCPPIYITGGKVQATVKETGNVVNALVNIRAAWRP